MVNTLADAGLQHISLSENGPVGFYRSFFLLAVLLYYFTVKRLIAGRENFQETLIYCLVGVGAFQAVYGLIQFINPQIGILWLANPERAAHGTIIYKNQYASLLNMIWPLALASGVLPYVNKGKKGIRGKGLGQRLKEKVDEFSTANTASAYCMIFAAGTMILAILFSLSRGGILAMVLYCVVTADAIAFFQDRRRSAVWRCLSASLSVMGHCWGLIQLSRALTPWTTPEPIGWRYTWLPCRCSGTTGLPVSDSAHTRCCLPCISRDFRLTSSTTGSITNILNY